MKTRFLLALALCGLGAACTRTAVGPSAEPATLSDEDAVGRLAVAFLNRFSASRVDAASCLVDFSDSCRGKRDELSDIEYNRAHYEIVGARLGVPAVRVNSDGNSASIAMSCAWDSDVTKCETAGCVAGSFEHVAGTCTLTALKEQNAWKLCVSNFQSSGPVSESFQNFAGPSN